MTEPIRVAIIGARGKMGRYAKELAAAEDDLAVVCEIDRGDDLPAALEAARPDVGLDFTEAGQGAEHGLVMIEVGVRPLIGTSGVRPQEDLALDFAARERGLGGLVVPNFSLGIWLQQKLALEAARFMEGVEILEEHHADKKDAPSGTAADTANQLAAALGVEPSKIPVHSVRLEGLYSNQTVMFGGKGQALRIAHETYGLAAFGPGILAGLRYAAVATGVARGIGHAFEHAAKG